MNVEDSLAWLYKTMSLPDGRVWGDTILSDPWIEHEILRPALQTLPDGLPRHRFLWNELSRGHAKTSLCAGIGLVECLRGDSTEVYCTASDTDQARILLEVAEGFLQRSKTLSRLFHQTVNKFTCPSTHSSMRVMSSDAPSFYGRGASALRLRFVLDEMCQWKTPALYHAAVTSMAKVKDSQLTIISNSGLVNSWQHVERLGAKDNGYRVFSAPGTIASWVTEQQLADIRSKVPEDIFRRFHENVWVEDTGDFIDPELWDACFYKGIPELGPDEEIILGIDAGITSDNFVIIACTRDTRPERRDDSVMVRGLMVWKPSKKRPVNFKTVEEWLMRCNKEHTILRIVYDPYQLTGMMQRFNEMTGVWCSAFQQGPRRLKSDTDLLRLIQQGRIAHGGEPILREHILNCSLKMNVREDSGARLVKKNPTSKIDCAVALSMAASECLRLYL